MKQSGIDWIGPIPDTWGTTRIKYVLKESNIRSIDGMELPLSLGRVCGLVPTAQKEQKTLQSASYVNAKVVYPGEIVFNRFKARIFAVSSYHGVVSPDYAVYQDRGGHDLKYFVYLFGTEPYRAAFDNKASGIGDGFSRLYTDDLFSMPTLLPPRDVQSRITAFLDNRCAKIDEAIARHQALIVKLDEYRKAVITDAVTKGVRGNSNWENKAIKHSFIVVPGATPSSGTPEYWDGNITWITPSDFKTNDHYVSTGAKSITEAGYNSCSTRLVPAGSLIFSKRAPIGTVSISKNPLCTNQGCLACVPKKKTNVEFFYYAFIANLEVFDVLGTGTTFKEISTSTFCNVKIATPSPSEQKEIVDYLDAKCAAIDSAKERHTQLIAKLEEYKKSLIYNAVTGKIEC